MVKPLPSPAQPAWPMLRLFNADAAAKLPSPFKPSLTAHRLAQKLNDAFASAIANGERAESAPRSSDVISGLSAFGNDCRTALARMGLDGFGQPPEQFPVLTIPFQPWFQWLKEGSSSLWREGESGPFDRVRLANTIATAERVVPQTIGVAAMDRISAIHDEVGHEIGPYELQAAYARAMIEAALEKAPATLALMALLIDAAKEIPRPENRKDNYERAFTRELFIRLTGIYGETFGLGPRAKTSEREPEGPAMPWFRAVLKLAAKKDGPLTADQLTAVASIESFEDTTLADRIGKGWASWEKLNVNPAIPVIRPPSNR